MVRIAEFDELMAGVASGSEDAVWQLAETYTPYILRAVRLSLAPRYRPKLDPQDFAQTLWKSILLRRADLGRIKSPEQLVAYLARATKNKILDKKRHYESEKRCIEREESLEEYAPDRQRRRDEKVLYATDPTPSTSASMRERWQWVLSHASKRERRIVELRLKGFTFEEVGSKLRIDTATVRRDMQRLIEKLSA